MTIDELWTNITAGAYALTDGQGEVLVATERARRAVSFEADLLATLDLTDDPRAPEILSLSRRLAGGDDAAPAAVAEAVAGLAKIIDQRRPAAIEPTETPRPSPESASR